MKKIVFLALILAPVVLFAQRPLETEDRSKENDLFAGKNNEACITLSFPQTLSPLFYDNDKRQKPAEIDTIGNLVNYHFVFEISEFDYRRSITIHVNDFTPLTIQKSFSPKQWLKYYIYDPDPTIVGCYDQLMREGMKLFTNGMYEDAKKKYESIKTTCSKIESETEIDQQIASVDSVLIWRDMADAYFDRSSYASAIENYQKILRRNASDVYARNRMSVAQVQQKEDCAAMIKMADIYFNEKDYANAQLLYEKVTNGSCNERSKAIVRLQEIILKQQHFHALTYEFSKNVPIGLSIGGYKDRKWSGYFTLRFNTEVFEVLRSNSDIDAKPELNISFGWTKKIVKPVWIFFGPGYTGIGQYIYKKEDLEEKVELSLSDLKIHSAVSPEIGLLGKVIIGKGIGIALRYTFQYRFAIDKETIDYIGEIRHVFGLGICF